MTPRSSLDAFHVDWRDYARGLRRDEHAALRGMLDRAAGILTRWDAQGLPVGTDAVFLAILIARQLTLDDLATAPG